MRTVCIVPTIRPECHSEFLSHWQPHFNQHRTDFVTVWDGSEPRITCNGEEVGLVQEVLADADLDLVFNYTDSVRVAGFLWAAEHLKPEVFYSLDDDTQPLPDSDPLIDLAAPLGQPCSLSWMNTLLGGEPLVRGFPYRIRSEGVVQVSHGGWIGSLDLDGPTQLLLSADPPTTADFYRGVIPRGVLAPFCGMAIAFTREAAPFVYYAPMGKRTPFNRFGDIWLGINLKRECDRRNWGIYYGSAIINHTRASDTFKNLAQEAEGLRYNEDWWEVGDAIHPYFQQYAELRTRYANRMSELLSL